MAVPLVLLTGPGEPDAVPALLLPAITDLGVSSAAILEGDTVELTGAVATLGALSLEHEVDIQWGDGSTDLLVLPAGERDVFSYPRVF